jgi:hypothetical protein
VRVYFQGQGQEGPQEPQEEEVAEVEVKGG